MRRLRDASALITATWRHACALILIAASSVPRVLTGQGVMLQGIVDAEAWSTSDSMSTRFLARNNGGAAVLGRMMLWGALEPVRDLVFYGQVYSVRGSAATAAEED